MLSSQLVLMWMMLICKVLVDSKARFSITLESQDQWDPSLLCIKEWIHWLRSILDRCRGRHIYSWIVGFIPICHRSVIYYDEQSPLIWIIPFLQLRLLPVVDRCCSWTCWCGFITHRRKSKRNGARWVRVDLLCIMLYSVTPICETVNFWRLDFCRRFHQTPAEVAFKQGTKETQRCVDLLVAAGAASPS